MQHLSPGFPLEPHLILAEELPVPPNAEFRIWRALRADLGKMVIVKIFPDHHVLVTETGFTPKAPGDTWAVRREPEKPGWGMGRPGDAPTPGHPASQRTSGFERPDGQVPKKVATKPWPVWWGLTAIIFSGLAVGVGYWYWLYRSDGPTGDGPREIDNRRSQEIFDKNKRDQYHTDSSAMAKKRQTEAFGAVHADTTAVVIIPPDDIPPAASEPAKEGEVQVLRQTSEPVKNRTSQSGESAHSSPGERPKKKVRKDTGVFVQDENL